MPTTPLTSIALATFNGAKFLDDQISSLLVQDYPNIEIVVSDDDSTDGTWDILQFYASKDKRINLLPRIKNLGYVRNFIRVFGACNGDFISPCDQDDIWHISKTSRLVAEIKDMDLIYCNNAYIDSEGRSMNENYSDSHKMFSGKDTRQLLFATSVCGHASLFRKELLKDLLYLKDLPYIDWAIAFLAANGRGVRYLDETLVDWRQHNSSFTSYAREKNATIRRRIIGDEKSHLRGLSKIPSAYEDFHKEVWRRYSNWEKSFFSPQMFLFVRRNKKITHRLHPSKYPELKYLVGNKLKKTLFPNY